MTDVKDRLDAFIEKAGREPAATPSWLESTLANILRDMLMYDQVYAPPSQVILYPDQWRALQQALPLGYPLLGNRVSEVHVDDVIEPPEPVAPTDCAVLAIQAPTPEPPETVEDRLHRLITVAGAPDVPEFAPLTPQPLAAVFDNTYSTEDIVFARQLQRRPPPKYRESVESDEEFYAHKHQHRSNTKNHVGQRR